MEELVCGRHDAQMTLIINQNCLISKFFLKNQIFTLIIITQFNTSNNNNSRFQSIPTILMKTRKLIHGAGMAKRKMIPMLKQRASGPRRSGLKS